MLEWCEVLRSSLEVVDQSGATVCVVDSGLLKCSFRSATELLVV